MSDNQKEILKRLRLEPLMKPSELADIFGIRCSCTPGHKDIVHFEQECSALVLSLKFTNNPSLSHNKVKNFLESK
ncbi:hypothetical protein C5472_10500 [Photorhabdus sp. RW14-46]|uniref:Photorhabdus luminescens subsp. laumondii TTO1 complete genome segment 4/17 n=1 Tax=Photorhabdus laumondii subsp. laumondii (strain DSM 15139 / CIP 105565 / TT01) TaxID=243265 RepID=Q7N7T7_PHOLL|nr:hypothetical protein [Photorhabdus sp. S14-60]AWK40933.1 hypothetical protein A4R40_05060 [Photorhabdus laumondii subsp. laumondii]NHB61540.1 hypothetical protein [Photorhabdus sp. RW14-46]RAW74409.1 hypothetical protein CKY15_04005 [Photorhabdus sp. S7-51]RAW79852.1 hypothetical protein CKY06_03525 [Photorhabdus sp. S15-56]RAW87513.1 hypothetical protein CKY09_05555 [Photorhabdus sp. S5P8-50]RAW88193.1 hypothetical protein CKY12_04005 [Photorhabdus sp. S12-55]CAE13311.1 unnamed protein p